MVERKSSVSLSEQVKDEKQLVKDFSRIMLDFLRSLREFPEERRDEILFDEWSLKDIVAHMSGWMIAAAGNIESLKQGQSPPWVESIDEFNQASIEVRSGLAWGETYTGLRRSSWDFVKVCHGLPAELWDEEIWPDRDLTPRKILEIEIEHWRDKHLAAIDKVVGQDD